MKGLSGQNLTQFVGVGIGGSYLGIEFVYEALRYHDKCSEAQGDRKLKFLANVCPVDFAKVVSDLDPEKT